MPFGEQAAHGEHLRLHPAGRTSFWGNLLINHDSRRLNCYHDRHDTPVDGFLLDRHSMPAGSSHSLVGRTARPHGGRSPFCPRCLPALSGSLSGHRCEGRGPDGPTAAMDSFSSIGQPVAFLECHSATRSRSLDGGGKVAAAHGGRSRRFSGRRCHGGCLVGISGRLLVDFPQSPSMESGLVGLSAGLGFLGWFVGVGGRPGSLSEHSMESFGGAAGEAL